MVWLFLLLPLWAQEVVVPSAEIETLTFEQYLLENPTHKSFTQSYMKKKPIMAPELFHYLKKAQYEFIDGSLNEARKFFEKIIELRHKEDWDKNHFFVCPSYKRPMIKKNIIFIWLYHLMKKFLLMKNFFPHLYWFIIINSKKRWLKRYGLFL